MAKTLRPYIITEYTSSSGSSGSSGYFFKASPSWPLVSYYDEAHEIYTCNLKISTNVTGTITCNTPNKIALDTVNGVSYANTEDVTWYSNENNEITFTFTEGTQGSITFEISSSNGSYSTTFYIEKSDDSSHIPILPDLPDTIDESTEDLISFEIKCKKIFKKRNNLVTVFKASTEYLTSKTITNISTIESLLVNDLLKKNPGPPATNGIHPNKVYWKNLNTILKGLIWNNNKFSLDTSSGTLGYAPNSWYGISHEDDNGTLSLEGMPYYKNDIL